MDPTHEPNAAGRGGLGRAAPPDRTHEAFVWLRSVRIESLNVAIEEYRHRASGAPHYHIAAENNENVFLVAFRTVPTDSTGVAHILEHTVLCGSRRYPVRDPFFMMTRRSLNTFMNAFTSSDWTAYPFASQNRRDFFNLMDVYLDAVFFPQLDELDFAQEGHRVEFETADDPASPLVYKGVVYNEMKGAMSAPVNVLWQTLTRHLFPTTTYHYNSGGDPAEIPRLGYEQLRSFYRTHYHPSNAVFMTYGDIPAYDHHERIERRALFEFTRQDLAIAVADEQRYTEPRMVEETYALDEDEAAGAKTHIVFGWLLGRSTDLKVLLRAHLLANVLLDNGASPLRRALETTDLGAAPSPLCGVEDSNREMTFVCGLEGSTPENAAALEALVLTTLTEVAERGAPRDQVEAALHQLELSQREITGDGHPYGLNLVLSALPAAIHRGDPVATLDLDPALEELRRAAESPSFIGALVRSWLLDNPHRVRLTLRPDRGLSAQHSAAEAADLAQLRAALGRAEQARIVERSALLKERQARYDDPDCLPKVGLADIPPETRIARGAAVAAGPHPATFYAEGTNGLVYQQIVVDLPQLEDELLEVLPYYSSCITELGVGGRDYLQTQAWQAQVSGGINAYSTVRGRVDDVQAIRGLFVLSSKALVRNSAALCELLHRTFEEVRFDELGRLREIIAQERARLEQSITGQGHGLAMLAAVSGMSPAAALAHRLQGLAGIRALKRLDDGLDEVARLAALAERLARIHERLRTAPRQYLVIGEAERQTQYVDELAGQQRAAPAAGPAVIFAPFAQPAIRERIAQMWVTSTSVNFCARAYPTVPVEHPDAAALAVLGGFLKNGYLHRAIREQGGAYGGGAAHDADNAAFRFYSYRDPRLAETLDDFDRSVAWLADATHEWRQVEEAILGVISQIDKPGSPAGEAKEAFHNNLLGRTSEQRQRYRRRVLQVTLDDLRRVAAAYLKPEHASTAVITSQAMHAAGGALGMELHTL